MIKIIVYILVFGVFSFLSMLIYFGYQSRNMTVKFNLENGLPDCPNTPNCVSSKASDEEKRIDPIIFENSKVENFISISTILKKEGGTIVEESNNWIHATFKSGFFGFIDDVLIYSEKLPTSQLEVYSRSRTGKSDLGVNKKRVIHLKNSFKIR